MHTDASLTVLSCDGQWQWKNIFSHSFAYFWCISNIFHFVRDSLWSHTWFHPSPDRLGLGVDTRSCGALQVANEPVKILYFPWNLQCWLHCIFATSMSDFIGISYKQAPWLKFDFLKIVTGRGQANIGAAMFSSPQKLSTAHIGIKCLLDWSKSTVLL